MKSWLWNVKIDEAEAKQILRDSAHEKFFYYATLLLSRSNEPKQVWKLLSKDSFCRHWNQIKRQMRKDRWNDKRIMFWNQIYLFLVRDFRKKGIVFSSKKEGGKVNPEQHRMGLEIVRLRKQQGMTQGDLAKKMGVTQQAISKIEKGTQSARFSTIAKIMKHLQVEADKMVAAPTVIDYSAPENLTRTY